MFIGDLKVTLICSRIVEYVSFSVEAMLDIVIRWSRAFLFYPGLRSIFESDCLAALRHYAAPWYSERNIAVAEFRQRSKNVSPELEADAMGAGK